MSIINYKDGRPIYEQIAEHYRRMILKGVLEEDEKMPSVRSLAMELSTNPNTVQKAFGKLLSDGYLYSVAGRGNFVAETKSLVQKQRKDIIIRMRRIRTDAKDLGMDAEELWEESK